MCVCACVCERVREKVGREDLPVRVEIGGDGCLVCVRERVCVCVRECACV